jgi:hypothetical protein
MTIKEAAQELGKALASASAEQAQDVSDLLEIGAGCISPAGEINFPERPDIERMIPPVARYAYLNMVDALYCNASGDEEFVPIHAGEWESVTATLVIERNWETISRVAKELRDEETDEHRAFRAQMRRAQMRR